MEAGYSHEQYVTGLINTIYAAAHDVNDFRTTQFLDWFIKEQGEEEENADNLIKSTSFSARTQEASTCLTTSLKQGFMQLPHL